MDDIVYIADHTLTLLTNPEPQNQFYYISDTELIHKVHLHIFRLWDCPLADQLPFPNCISLERHHMPSITRSTYVITEKTDGTRMLLLMMDFNAYMIDRAGKVFEVKVAARAIHFKGTLLDGELVRTHDGFYRYLVFDIIATPTYNDIRKAPFMPVRYNTIRQVLSDKFGSMEEAHQGRISSLHTSPQIHFCIKPMYDLEHTESLLTEMGHSDHRTDGLIFQPKATPVWVGTQNDCFKWKLCHTVDLMLVFQKDAPTEVHYRHKGININATRNGIFYKGHRFTIKSHASDNKIFRTLENEARASPQERTEHIVECIFDVDFLLHTIHWFIIRVRDDKDTANTQYTVKKTLDSIADHIEIDAIVALGQ